MESASSAAERENRSMVIHCETLGQICSKGGYGGLAYCLPVCRHGTNGGSASVRRWFAFCRHMSDLCWAEARTLGSPTNAGGESDYYSTI